MSTQPLTGRVALVTGAGRGIGRAVAESLAAAGASVVLAARSQPDIDAVAQAIEVGHGRALAVACDVRDATQVEALVTATVQHFQGLDILVNNAGTFQIAPLADTDEALWDSIVDTNLKGAFLVTRAALPHLVARRGHILNMVSVAGRMAFAGDAAYCASKWGLLGLTNVLREELRPLGVRVTALLPGAVDTPIWDPVPGRWNRQRMLRPEILGRSVAELCALPPEASPDEFTITPTGGPQ